jgi:response regulator RpfG family c-di-GMP phosphodiesterase
MSNRILFIDDEKNVLAAFQRTLAGEFDVSTALSAAEGYKSLDNETPPAVVVCDMRMPGTSGVEALRRFSRESPDTIRIMLTGNADQETAVRAINEGKIFRYLQKPCPDNVLRETLRDAVNQHNVVTAERTLLEKTLLGSVRVLMDLLSVSHPELFGRATRARKWVKPLVKLLNQRNIGDDALTAPRIIWELQLGAALWPIGLITIPADLVARGQSSPDSLSTLEAEILTQAPETGAKLLAHIPRMENVVRMIQYHDCGFDGVGGPAEAPKGTAIPEGARIIKFLKDLAATGPDETPTPSMLAELRKNANAYDPAIMGNAHLLWGKSTLFAAQQRQRFTLSVGALLAGDHLIADIMTREGKLLLSAGQQISVTQLERLRNLSRLQNLREPIEIERDS